MRVAVGESLKRQYGEAPAEVQRAFDKQLLLLLGNLQYPSIHAKKYDESTGVWQGRVNRDWRFYFRIVGDYYELVSITKHPK